MKYEIIQSGSDGNCTIVNDRIAIDIGAPWYRIEQFSPDLKLVLCTHEHGDHFNRRTVRTLARKRPTIRWACGEWMAEHLIAAGVDRRNIDVLEMGHWYRYRIGDAWVSVSGFETRHDVRNCGWKLSALSGSLFYATDLGTLDGIDAQRYDVYLLEANYTEADLQHRMEEKLEAGEFAHESRVAETHLSWEEAAEWLRQNMAPHSVWIPMHQHKEREARQDAQSTVKGNYQNIEKSKRPE